MKKRRNKIKKLVQKKARANLIFWRKYKHSNQ